MPNYLSVAIPTPLRKSFQYRCPDNTTVTLGSRVEVPFGNRVVTGIVVSIDAAPVIALARIKPITKVLDELPVLPPSIFELCMQTARYYKHPIGEVFSTALPQLIRRGKTPARSDLRLCLTHLGTGLDLETLSRAPARQALLRLLRAKPACSKQQLKAASIRPHTINASIDKGWAAWRAAAPVRGYAFSSANDEGMLPSAEQQAAVQQILSKTGCYLLHGITGSGKTEVYMRVIEQHLHQGRQALVLVPEIGLTPQTVRRFSNRFDAPIVVLHSRLTDRERALAWLDAREGRAAIVLGTRSAIFTPLKKPGIIVVDEEHDMSFKQWEGFRYSARDLAVLRGKIEDIPVILGSATPSLESLHNAKTNRYTLAHLSTRAAGAAVESYHLIDTNQTTLQEGFSKPLLKMMQERIKAGEQVLVFINRRGFAPVLFCNQCQWIAQCRHCDSRLTYHLSQHILVCHHCGHQERKLRHCQACQATDLVPLGLGTQRIEQTLGQLFPKTPVIRVDRDSTRRKGAMAGFIDQVTSGAAAILVGTQLLAKGHHFPGITLVAILDIDAAFFSSDFKSLEHIGQLILQVGGRAGRAQKPGKVVIQTQFAKHPLLQTLINRGYTEFAHNILAEREKMGLPPYCYHTLIRAESQDPRLAKSFLEGVAEASAKSSVPIVPGVSVLGPVPALMEKKANKFRQLLLLASPSRQKLHQELARKIEQAESLPLAKKVHWSVDVDPLDLF